MIRYKVSDARSALFHQKSVPNSRAELVYEAALKAADALVQKLALSV